MTTKMHTDKPAETAENRPRPEGETLKKQQRRPKAEREKIAGTNSTERLSDVIEDEGTTGTRDQNRSATSTIP